MSMTMKNQQIDVGDSLAAWYWMLVDVIDYQYIHRDIRKNIRTSKRDSWIGDEQRWSWKICVEVKWLVDLRCQLTTSILFVRTCTRLLFLSSVNEQDAMANSNTMNIDI